MSVFYYNTENQSALTENGLVGKNHILNELTLDMDSLAMSCSVMFMSNRA